MKAHSASIASAPVITRLRTDASTCLPSSAAQPTTGTTISPTTIAFESRNSTHVPVRIHAQVRVDTVGRAATRHQTATSANANVIESDSPRIAVLQNAVRASAAIATTKTIASTAAMRVRTTRVTLRHRNKTAATYRPACAMTIRVVLRPNTHMNSGYSGGLAPNQNRGCNGPSRANFRRSADSGNGAAKCGHGAPRTRNKKTATSAALPANTVVATHDGSGRADAAATSGSAARSSSCSSVCIAVPPRLRQLYGGRFRTPSATPPGCRKSHGWYPHRSFAGVVQRQNISFPS